jgi:periplasmic divalent cation tolerance protein
MNEYIQVVTTTANRDEALAIARSLIDKRLAACVQIGGPITSIYRWREQIESSEEWVCIAKTQRKFYAEVEQAILSLHTYDTPEILVVPIVEGSAKYLSWLKAETSAPE